MQRTIQGFQSDSSIEYLLIYKLRVDEASDAVDNENVTDSYMMTSDRALSMEAQEASTNLSYPGCYTNHNTSSVRTLSKISPNEMFSWNCSVIKQSTAIRL